MQLKILSGREDLSDPFYVRDEVFTKEQGFANPDSDQFDPVATHAVLYDDGKPVATGRVFCEGSEGVYHIGRICVLKPYRGLQLGRQIMDALEAQARAKGARTLVLGAQLYAIPFYQKCGFCPTGERYMDEFCEHEMLVKDLQN